ncbi:hypothetical protein [Gordonia sp. NB41Y]|uniref:DUF7426 family protein n=1 Tax=Gordonia sp. NB41Y TaxID=875808 RepID=UPI0002BE3643|nr:hypothetical protein [Gordonia sp. NB41Y]EMP10043.1 hypothetical protein ISGA_1817 [Gordonia sp. NB41Y]WLP90258.1 hypothetical protein Q9K23_22535 [Gordonia sp. NB41Y]
MGKDLSALLSPRLEIEWGGKTFTLPPLMADDGLRLRNLMHNPMMGFTDDGEIREIMRLFGATWEPRLIDIDVLDPITGVPRLDDDGNVVTMKVDEGSYVGGVYGELKEAGAAWADILRIGKYCLIHAGMGEFAADAWLAAEVDELGNPQAPTSAPSTTTGENRKTRGAATKKAAPRKAATKKAAGGRTSASRARTAGTT